jgi:hypothetical protein
VGPPATRRGKASPTSTWATWSSARTRPTCPWPPRTGVSCRVSPVPCVATEEEDAKASGKNPTSPKKRGRGNLGREATPQEQRQLESVVEATSGRKGVSAAAAAAAAAARRGSPAVCDREAEPRAGGCEDQCGREDERDVIRECREGSRLPPPPPLQPAPEDLERRQAVDRLFTLYESQHVQMMEIRALLCK